MRNAVALVMALAAGANASPVCPAGTRPMTQTELFFGRDIAGGAVVGEADWRRFADEEITPRFPDGLTVEDAYGQWKGRDGAVVRERSKRVTIVLAGAPGEAAKLEAVREAYKRLFHQESVMLVEYQVCGSL